MNSVETGNSNKLEAYKSSIMKRYELALAKTGGTNCHGAAYYLLGVLSEEPDLDAFCRVNLDICQPVDDINNALFVAFGASKPFVKFKDRDDSNILWPVHLAVLHPYDKTKVIHRDLEGYYQTRRSYHNFFTEIADTFDMLTKGLNPMRIEPLKDVQERWKDFPMQPFCFKPDYFDKLL